jgi:hypothetical protein
MYLAGLSLTLAVTGCGGGGGGTSGGEVIGRVVDATTGLPLEGVTVTISSAVRITPASGRFEFTGLPTTAVNGLAQLAGYRDKAFTFDAPVGPDPSDAGDILMVVTSSGDTPPGPYTVWGTVQLEGLADAAGATVEVVGGSDTYTIGSGSTYYLWLAPGTYTLKASRSGYQSHEVQGVTVVDVNTPVRQDFSLAP